MSTTMNVDMGHKAAWIEPKIEHLHVNETAGHNLNLGSDTPPASTPSLTGS